MCPRRRRARGRDLVRVARRSVVARTARDDFERRALERQHCLPRVDDDVPLQWLSGSDDAFGQVTISAYKLGTAIKVSEELINDSVFDIETAELTPKPQRACYERLMAHCGFEADGALLVEDTLHNLEPAHDMGFATALVGVVHPQPRPAYVDHWAPDVKALLRAAR